jgi:BirA family biotin operon repressor/biotin-[acetyl-CoA-carboxylase] ligase
MTNDLSERRLDEILPEHVGRPFRFMESTASTNTDAMRWALDGAPEGSLVVADHQTEGRGRWGREWLSAPGRSLLFSVVLRPRRDDRLGLLSTALGVACATGIAEYTGLATKIKWPNDVTLEERKVAGILVETTPVETETIAIAGIGVNVFWAPQDLRRAGGVTSIAAEMTQGRPDRARILAAILEALSRAYLQLQGPVGAERTLADATARSSVLDRDVVVTLANGEAITGVARRLAPTGGLEVDAAGGTVVVDSGEISHLRPL